MRKMMKLGVWVVLMVAAFFVGVTAARAAGYEAICTAELGGVWNEDEQSCTFSTTDEISTTFCRDAAYAILYFGAGDDFVRCVDFVDEMTIGVTAGEPVDAWNGNCGVYILNPPVSGYVVVAKAGYHTNHRAPDFVKPTCRVTYYDAAGNVMEEYGSLAWMYFNLDATTRKLWDAGELQFYYLRKYRSGFRWWYCKTVYEVDAGEYGRVACLADQPYQFGIGVKSARQ